MLRSLLMAALLVGCAGGEQLDPGESDDVIDSKADGTTPLRMGVYDVDFGVYYAMTLEADGNFMLRGGCKPGPTGPHCFAITELPGHYRLTHSGSKKYLRLYSDIDGSLVYKFQYKVSGKLSETVKLTDTKTEKEYTATLEEADHAQDGESCGGFVANVRSCADGLICKAAAQCCDLPGVCVPASN
jgi:hypothetical protein